MIAAVYGALTILTVKFLGVFAWGPVQFRVSEAATVVALFTPAAIPGLTIGSLLANLFSLFDTGSPLAVLDVVFGSAATLLGAVWTWRFRRHRSVALLGPVIANALIVPAYLPVIFKSIAEATNTPLAEFYRFDLFGAGVDLGSNAPYVAMYLFGVVTVGIGQAVVVYGLGLPLASALRRLGGELFSESAAQNAALKDSDTPTT